MIFNKFKRLQLLSKIKDSNKQELINIKDDFNKKIDKYINRHNEIYVSLNQRTEILNFSKIIKDEKVLSTQIITAAKNYFKDKKRKYTVVIFLKNQKIKSFDVFENTNITGFYLGDEYYNLDRNSVIKQNNNAFSFYLEGCAAPINFTNSQYNVDADSHQLELGTNNLRNIIDGKAFQGIMNLGKPTTGFWENVDWKMAVIGLAVIILGFLHVTGQIDLVEMFGL